MPKKAEKQPDILSSLMKGIAGEGGKPASFPVMLILLAVFVIIVSVMGIQLARAKRKAARLASKQRKLEEKKTQAAENLRLAKNKAEREDARAQIDDLSSEIIVTKSQIKDQQHAHRQYVAKLKSVTSWDDIEVSK